MLKTISALILPAIFIIILGYASLRRVPVFDTFLNGAAKGLSSAVTILPALVGLLCAISMLRASGLLDYVGRLLSPVLSKTGMPQEVLPLALLKPVSGSGALAMIKDVFDTSGVDSFAGKVASVMLGSSETTFYTLAVYYGAVGIRDSRYTVSAAVLADLVGVFAAVLVCHLWS